MEIAEKKENKKKMRFLLGESMGGAVLLLVHRKKPDYWDGAVLVAPMCKVMCMYYMCHFFLLLFIFVCLLPNYYELFICFVLFNSLQCGNHI